MKVLTVILVMLFNQDYKSFVIKYGCKDYDITSAYKAFKAGKLKIASNGHLPDTYKLPTHITFSNESIYSTPQHTGGVWYQVKSVWHYKPSAYVLTKHTVKELKVYFAAYERDSILDL